VGTESPTFIEPVQKRKDGIEAMFMRQAAKATAGGSGKRKREPSPSTEEVMVKEQRGTPAAAAAAVAHPLPLSSPSPRSPAKRTRVKAEKDPITTKKSELVDVDAGDSAGESDVEILLSQSVRCPFYPFPRVESDGNVTWHHHHHHQLNQESSRPRPSNAPRGKKPRTKKEDDDTSPSGSQLHQVSHAQRHRVKQLVLENLVLSAPYVVLVVLFFQPSFPAPLKISIPTENYARIRGLLGAKSASQRGFNVGSAPRTFPSFCCCTLCVPLILMLRVSAHPARHHASAQETRKVPVVVQVDTQDHVVFCQICRLRRHAQVYHVRHCVIISAAFLVFGFQCRLYAPAIVIPCMYSTILRFLAHVGSSMSPFQSLFVHNMRVDCRRLHEELKFAQSIVD
jgi:hypothetical protein